MGVRRQHHARQRHPLPALHHARRQDQCQHRRADGRPGGGAVAHPGLGGIWPPHSADVDAGRAPRHRHGRGGEPRGADVDARTVRPGRRLGAQALPGRPGHPAPDPGGRRLRGGRRRHHLPRLRQDQHFPVGVPAHLGATIRRHPQHHEPVRRRGRRPGRLQLRSGVPDRGRARSGRPDDPARADAVRPGRWPAEPPARGHVHAVNAIRQGRVRTRLRIEGLPPAPRDGKQDRRAARSTGRSR